MWRRWLRWGLAGAAILILIAASTQIVLDTDREPAGGPYVAEPGQGGDAVAALNGLTGPPTLFGEVTAVLGPDTVVVEVAGRPITVQVIGADSADTPGCAQDAATAFARMTLTGQSVTLVPDPTLPPGTDARVWPAYLVLATQQSYTDMALRAGWVSAGQGRYRPGFLERERQARTADAGMWGPPCNRP